MNSWIDSNGVSVEVLSVLLFLVFVPVRIRSTQLRSIGDHYIARCQSGTTYSFDSGDTHAGRLPAI